MSPDRLILPPPLVAGDTIGICAPASPSTEPKNIEVGLHLLRDQGYQVKILPQPGQGNTYLSAPDDKRLHDFHSLWADDEIRAIMALRGGFGCLRIIDQLDFQFIQKHPKTLVGFSDITILLNTIWQKTGLITMHGPVLSSLPHNTNDTIGRFFSSLKGDIKDWNNNGELEILKPGEARGYLLGGNLTTLMHLLGTPWEIAWDKTILFLEDTCEPMYKIDRMFTHLYHCGVLKRLGGLILGNFDMGKTDPLDHLRFQEHIWSRVLELTEKVSYPVWANFPIGHQEHNFTLPVGMVTEMNSRTGTLHFARDTFCR